MSKSLSVYAEITPISILSMPVESEAERNNSYDISAGKICSGGAKSRSRVQKRIRTHLYADRSNNAEPMDSNSETFRPTVSRLFFFFNNISTYHSGSLKYKKRRTRLLRSSLRARLAKAE